MVMLVYFLNPLNKIKRSIHFSSLYIEYFEKYMNRNFWFMASINTMRGRDGIPNRGAYLAISGLDSGDATESQSSQKGGGGPGDKAQTVRGMRRGEDGDGETNSG